MTLEEAEKLARQLMGEHKLLDSGWIFAFNRRRSQSGTCYYPNAVKPGRIELSMHYVQLNGEADVRDTLLHEIAHALAGLVGHGPLWQAVCRRIGARPDRCTGAAMPKGRWRAKCPSCEMEHHRHRRPRSLTGYHCIFCGPERGQIVWSAPPGVLNLPRPERAGTDCTDTGPASPNGSNLDAR
jgi:predicted SprT family Zn-dependent metalloprotease